VSLPARVEINGQRANIDHEVQGFGGFLGVPALFTSYRNATHYLGFRAGDGMYVLARVADGQSVMGVKRQLTERLPEVDVLTREEFARKARWYWVIKTGAGSAILTAGILGFLI
jgi:putative ABC transport system permease protein